MILRRFGRLPSGEVSDQQLAADFAELNDWYEAHGKPRISRDILPGFGVIVSGVGACFLYRTDSCIAYVEGAVTNPCAPAELRHQAMLEGMAMLEEYAAQNGFRLLMAQVSDEATIARTAAAGMRRHSPDYTLMVKEL